MCVDECLWKPNSSREEEEEEEVWGFIAELKNLIVLQREDTKSTLYKSPRGAHVCVRILVQASSCGPIRVLLSVIWGHFVQASLGQTWDGLIRFKVSIRTEVYSKVWIMDLTKFVSVEQHCPHTAEHIRDSNTHICPSITARPLINRMLSWLLLGFIHWGYFLSKTLCSLEKKSLHV